MNLLPWSRIQSFEALRAENIICLKMQSSVVFVNIGTGKK
jgi:hypothetical protein